MSSRPPPARTSRARFRTTAEPPAGLERRAPKSVRQDALALLLRQEERAILLRAIETCHGRTRAVMKLLGLSRRALEQKMLAHGLRPRAQALRDQAERAALAADRPAWPLLRD